MSEVLLQRPGDAIVLLRLSGPDRLNALDVRLLERRQPELKGR